jgi:tRNA G10  N-methylase Trm11
LSYLEKYAKGKAVLLDPFAGSGIFVYAALLRGMKAIYNDLCPYGIFLARNVMRPFNPSEFMMHWMKCYGDL